MRQVRIEPNGGSRTRRGCLGGRRYEDRELFLESHLERVWFAALFDAGDEVERHDRDVLEGLSALFRVLVSLQVHQEIVEEQEVGRGIVLRLALPREDAFPNVSSLWVDQRLEKNECASRR